MNKNKNKIKYFIFLFVSRLYRVHTYIFILIIIAFTHKSLHSLIIQTFKRILYKENNDKLKIIKLKKRPAKNNICFWTCL